MAGDTQVQQLLDQYSQAMIRKRLAGGTVHKRVTLARGWLVWIGDGWVEAGWRDIDRYGDTRKIEASTWAGELSHLSDFYRWAWRNDLVTADPTDLVERPKVGIRLPRPASELQYKRLLDGAPPMMRAIIELMACTGMRCCEVSRLRWSDVDLIERTALVRGKGNRERLVGLPHRVVQALAAIDDSDGHVIHPAHFGRHTAQGISKNVRYWCHHQRVPVTAHMLRHFFATVMLDAADGDIKIVQAALGHASSSTTDIYARASRRRAQEAARRLDRYFGEGRLFDC